MDKGMHFFVIQTCFFFFLFALFPLRYVNFVRFAF
uniref:Uncharacterized protein n=1 Tax=Rhizophora mucronata TaxID=61149 RepID=A0A2P2NFD1_RHIMU